MINRSILYICTMVVGRGRNGHNSLNTLEVEFHSNLLIVYKLEVHSQMKYARCLEAIIDIEACSNMCINPIIHRRQMIHTRIPTSSRARSLNSSITPRLLTDINYRNASCFLRIVILAISSGMESVRLPGKTRFVGCGQSS